MAGGHNPKPHCYIAEVLQRNAPATCGFSVDSFFVNEQCIVLQEAVPQSIGPEIWKEKIINIPVFQASCGQQYFPLS